VKTVQITPAEMQARHVHFKSLKPRSQLLQSSEGVPAEVNEFFAADRNYTLLAPKMGENSPITSTAALAGGDHGDAISVSLAFCGPGSGPQLHAHMNTVEMFFCLKSRFKLVWGDEGENEIVLEPYDFLPVPKGVMRTFTNIGDEEGALLVIIQGNKGEFRDVINPPIVADMVRERWGEEMLATLKKHGRLFIEDVGEAAE
jgi:mannose-6-phosphate isomerase-like protein (cupin superfamily)